MLSLAITFGIGKETVCLWKLLCKMSLFSVLNLYERVDD